jgi:D-alanyl-D-alanine carboxypeptidase/D-alanyl-D-alanine-endopeptidase (penicillin-binding protein 4)
MRLLFSVSAAALLLAAPFAPPSDRSAARTADLATARPAAVAAPAEVSAAVDSLRDELASLIRAPGWSSARYSVLVVSLDRGDTLFALNADRPLAPASNLKLYTTAAALYYLGPDFRFSTYVLGDGEVRGGVLDGDLILYGTGDPTISGRMLSGSVAAIESLADSLHAAGVREVTGDLVGDATYFDAAPLGPGWDPSYRLASYSAPVGALSFAENLVSVRVLPGAVGQPARIETAPRTEGMTFSNQVRTVASGRTSVNFEHGEGGVVLRGQIARGHPGIARTLPVVDPADFTTAAFRAALRSRGIELRGGVRVLHDPARSRVSFAARPGTSAAPADRAAPRVLAIHRSPPLVDIVRVTNVVSHNLFAEALLKEIGRVALGDGSFAGGARAVQYLLECETDLDTTTLHLVDGSGLSRLNQVTAHTTIALLDFMARSDVWEPFYASLPEAADPNGLRRMHGTAAAGNLRAKTGTINNVSSLSGYVRSADGERLAFSIIANDVPSTWRAKRTEDAIGARLAAFRRPAERVAEAAPAVIEPDSTPTAAEPDSATTPAAAPAPAEPEPAAKPAPRPKPAAKPAPARTYTIKQGDTLDGIARRHGTTVRELQRANPGIEPRRIRPGQKIALPR